MRSAAVRRRTVRSAGALVLSLAMLAIGVPAAQAGVPSGTPIGNLDGVSAVSGGVLVRGWAWDSNTAAAVNVAITTPGTTTVAANVNRSDVPKAYPKAGSKRGFEKVVTLGAGTHKICVTAKNVGAGADRSFGCRTVSVGGSATAAPALASGAGSTVAATYQSLTGMGWMGKEEAASGRITTVTGSAIPGSGGYRPSQALKVQLRAGDLTKTGSYIAPRSEVFGRQPSTLKASYTAWPDPAGSQRWYRIRFFVPADFTFAKDTTWLTLTQWKGLNGGSPPVALEFKRDRLRMAGSRANESVLPNKGDLGPVAKGQWTEITVGLSLSPDKSKGWVEVYRNGKQAMKRTATATMDTWGGKPTPSTSSRVCTGPRGGT